jgi:hypothetical protein
MEQTEEGRLTARDEAKDGRERDLVFLDNYHLIHRKLFI